jgi:large subunit ribosomal protein L3
MKFILGNKIEMTQIWKDDSSIAVTKVQVGPCTVTQVRTEDKDKYNAVQVGFGEKKKKNINKPQLGHFKGLNNFRYQKEFRMETGELKRGDVVDISSFEVGDNIQVTAVSKGRGFQGVVKRYGFAGQIKTHGNKDQLRMPGSIGATGPAHVFKGTRMGGRMGGDQVTVKNLEVIDIDAENNILYIKGAVPGYRTSLVWISGEGDMKVLPKEEKKKEVKKEEIKEVKETKKREAKKEEKVKKEVKQEKKEEVKKTGEEKNIKNEDNDKKEGK